MRHRYIQIEGELIPVGEDYREIRGFQVMPDIQPYISMIDGTEITSRSRHREHLRAHNCIEVGNDSSVLNPRPRPTAPPPGRKEHIIRAVNMIEERERRRR